MAFTIALHDSGASTSGVASGATWNTNSKVFTSGRLYVLFVGHPTATAEDGEPTAVAIPTGSGTWTRRHVRLASVNDCAVFSSDDASGTSVLRVTNGGINATTGRGWILYEITGQHAAGTLGDGVEAAGSDNAGSTTPSADSGTPLAGSAMLGFFEYQSDIVSFTAGTDYTALPTTPATHSAPLRSYIGEYDLAGNTDGIADGTLSSSEAWMCFAVEIKIAAAAATHPGWYVSRGGWF